MFIMISKNYTLSFFGGGGAFLSRVFRSFVYLFFVLFHCFMCLLYWFSGMIQGLRRLIFFLLFFFEEKLVVMNLGLRIDINLNFLFPGSRQRCPWRYGYSSATGSDNFP